MGTEQNLSCWKRSGEIQDLSNLALLTRRYHDTTETAGSQWRSRHKANLAAVASLLYADRVISDPAEMSSWSQGSYEPAPFPCVKHWRSIQKNPTLQYSCTQNTSYKTIHMSLQAGIFLFQLKCFIYLTACRAEAPSLPSTKRLLTLGSC